MQSHVLFNTICNYLALFVYGICLLILGTATIPIQNYFGVSESDVGMLFLILSLGFTIAVLSAGYIIDKTNLKTLSISGQAVLTIGLLITVSTLIPSFKNFPVAIAGYALMGIGGGLLEVSTNTAISQLYEQRRSSALNLLHMMFGIGALISPVYASYTIEFFGQGKWQLVYLFVAGLSLIVLILFITAKFPDKQDSQRTDFKDMLKTWKSFLAIILSVATICYVGSETTINNWTVSYMEKQNNIESSIASFYVTLFWIAITCGRFICSIILTWIKEITLLIILCVSAIGFYIFFLFAEDKITIGISIFLLGLAFSGIFPLIMAIASIQFKHRIASITSIIMTSMGIGLLSFPYLVSLMFDFYSTSAGMKMIFIVLAILLLIVLFVRVNSKFSKTEY